MSLWIPEWSNGNWGWTITRMTETEHDQRKFDQYGASFNRGKRKHNCCWNQMILPRCDLQSSIAWNICWNHQSSPRHEKNFSRYVSKLLDDEHKWNRVPADLDYMSHWHAMAVTGVKKWAHYFKSEMKSASKQWVVKGDNHPVKAKQERSAGKVYLAVFYDNLNIVEILKNK